jgi:hypothetical protein
MEFESEFEISIFHDRNGWSLNLSLKFQFS